MKKLLLTTSCARDEENLPAPTSGYEPDAHASWLRELEANVRDMGMKGPASASAIAR